MENVIGENVRRIRNERGWTQAQLAAAADVSERMVQRAEAGTPLSAEGLQAIAGALNVDLERLRKDEDVEREKAEAANFISVPLQLVERPGHLAPFLDGAMASMFSIVGLDSEEHDELGAELKQYLTDLIDIWAQLSEPNRRELLGPLGALLDRLSAEGIAVTAGGKAIKVKDQAGSFVWEILFVTISPKEQPVLTALVDKRNAFRFAI